MSEYIVEISEWVIDANGNSPFGKSQEIVHCKDCKHRYGCLHLIEVMQEDGDGDYLRMPVEPDGFCAWGERRDA